MKRLQIYIEEDLDNALAVEALKRRTSKAALIREFVRDRIGGWTRKPDPIDALVGDLDIDPIDDIDAVIYDNL